MAAGRPSDEIPKQWYDMARTVDQNWAANEVFSSSYRQQDLLPDIRKGIWETEPEGTISKVIKELKTTSSRTVRSAEWRLDQDVLYFRGKIYVPDYVDLRRRIVSLCHDTKVAGHPGRWKTLELASRNYWWPQMSWYIGKYTSTCDLCIHTKTQRHKPIGKLQPLPIPDAPWDTISVDFIRTGFESIGEMVGEESSAG